MKTSYLSRFIRSLRGCSIAGVLLASSGLLPSQEMPTRAIDVSQLYQALCDRGVYTMIPRSSVIHIPEGMEHKLGQADGRQLVSLSEFMGRNYCWVHKMHVSMAEATGEVSIDPLRLERVSKLGKVVIAVHKGKVISVRKSKPQVIAKAE